MSDVSPEIEAVARRIERGLATAADAAWLRQQFQQQGEKQPCGTSSQQHSSPSDS